MILINRYALTDIFRRNIGLATQAFDAQCQIGASLIRMQGEWMKPWGLKSYYNQTAAHLGATGKMMAQAGTKLDHAPDFAIDGARQKTVSDQTFYRIERFQADDNMGSKKPTMLIVAPMSGHYASILRDTMKGMLASHNVMVVDWKNPRDVPLSHGAFDFETYMECTLEAIQAAGPSADVMGISQSTVPLLAISAYMEKHKDPASPRSLTLIGGPIDTRKSDTKMHDFARGVSLKQLRKQVVDPVPVAYKGKGRDVYPGFTQLMALMGQGRDKHQTRLSDLYAAQINDDADQIKNLSDFYNDYYAVMDLDAEFFLDTLHHVYQQHSLATGQMTFRGEDIDLKSIQKMSLLTVEGAKDSVSPPGETHAAHDLCPHIPDEKRQRFTHVEFGHYGIAMGPSFIKHIAPIVAKFTKGGHTPNGPRPGSKAP